MNDNLEEIIKSLGISRYKIKDDELWCLCLNPSHADSHIGSFSINLKTGKCFCFSCQFRANIIQLLALQGVSYAKSFYLWNNSQEIKLELPQMPLDEYEVKFYLNKGLSPYAIKRVGENAEALLNEYHVAQDNEGNPVFLTRDFRGWNSIWVRENERYYLIEPLSARKTGCLFGEDLPPTSYTILTEGPFDALAVRKHTGYKAVCGFGTWLSAAQLRKLNNISNLVLFMDGDKAGIIAKGIIADKLKTKGDLWVAGGYSGDPDELGEKIPEILEKKKPVNSYKFWKIKNNMPSMTRRGP